MNDILKYAAMAPSGHNTQPWNLRVSDHHVEIYFDRGRALPEVDPTHREAILSLSAFAQTLMHAADASGFDSEIECLDEEFADGESPLFRVQLTSAEKPENRQALTLIESRFTDRNNYDTEEIPEEIIRKILSLDPDRLAYFPKDSNEGRHISECHVQAFIQQSNNQRKQAELADWLRFDRSDKSKHPDGLFPEMMGMGPLARFFWYSFFSRETAMKDSFVNTSIKNARKQIDHTAGFLVIISNSSTLPDICESGRLYLDVLLKCTELDVKNQTISQVLEEAPWKDTIAGDLGLKQPVQFIIRTGFSKSKKYGSHIRRKPDQIIH